VFDVLMGLAFCGSQWSTRTEGERGFVEGDGEPRKGQRLAKGAEEKFDGI
jgi:hypothetical protein